jgi:pyrroloquinoline quinone (PQQ) biosynthesis protein C
MYKDVKEKAVAEMVHKQIYIEERHERLLKRISKARGVSEAELTRQASGHYPLLTYSLH